MIVGTQSFKNYTYVMAIVNLTPDSFYPASRTNFDGALFRVERALNEGAAVIDLGAQSTRPSHTEVSAEVELSRLEKPLTEIRKRFPVPISVDTYYPEVAAAALSMGADMINDVWGLTRGNMAQVIAAANASVCIMHNAPKKLEGDPFPEVESFLKAAAGKALAAGIYKDKICLDGGVGFAKDAAQNLTLMDGYAKLSRLGYPLLLGHSRKSVFGGNVEDRLPATLKYTRLAARSGVLFVRVHDVKDNVEAIREEYERN